MAKKPFKVLSATALAAVLASSAIVPTAVFAAETTQSVDKVIVEHNGAIFEVSYDDYTNAKSAGVNFGPVKYVVASNGKQYKYEDFTVAKPVGSTVDGTLDLLEKDPSNVQDVKPGTVEIGEDGKPVYKEPVTDSFEVIEISAINETSVTVSFPSDSGVTAEGLKGKTLTLKAGESTFIATYVADTFATDKATFKLAEGELLVAGTAYAVTSSDLKVTEGATVTLAVAELTVKSVSVVNDSTIAVTFSDDTTAEIALDEPLVEGENTVTFTFNEKEYTATFDYTLPVAIAAVEPFEDITIIAGQEPKLPAKAKVVYEDETEAELDVTWDLTDIDFTKAGTIPVTGTVGEDTEVTINIIVVSESQLQAKVDLVKSEAEKTGVTGQAAFNTALADPALKIKNIKEANAEEYLMAIKEAFVVKTVEDIQALVNSTNKAITEAQEEFAAQVISDIKAAKTTTALQNALTGKDANGENIVGFDGFEGVIVTTPYLASYKAALSAANLVTLKDVQNAVNEANVTQLTKAIVKAEKSKVVADATTANDEYEAIVAKYVGEDFEFDAPAEGEDVGALLARINAATLAATEAEALATAIEGVVETPAEGTILEKLAALKLLDESLTFVNADVTGDLYAKAYASQLVADFDTPAKKLEATVGSIQKSLNTAEKLVLADATADVFEATQAVDNPESITAPERTAVKEALAIIKEINDSLTYKEADANVDQYIIDLNKTFNTVAKQKAATVKSIQNVITAADAKVVAGAQAVKVAAVFAAADSDGEVLVPLKALETVEGSVKDANKAAYIAALKAVTAPTKATEASIKALVETVNTQETAKLAKAVITAAKGAEDEAGVRTALDNLKADVNALAEEDIFTAAVDKDYQAALAKLALTATVEQIETAVAEVNTVTAFNTVVADPGVGFADLRTEISKITLANGTTAYTNLTSLAKVDVAELVKENAPEDGFTSLAQILDAVQKQVTAQPAMVAEINDATTIAQTITALNKISTDFKALTAAKKEDVAEGFLNQKNGETSPFPYKSLQEVRTDLAKVIASNTP